MEFFIKYSANTDSRITIETMQLKDGSFEKYPQGSFTFEYLLNLQLKDIHIYTHTTCTPNTFITNVPNNYFFKQLSYISKAKAGTSAGFFFYESTIWLLNKNQKEQTPFFFNLQTLNIFNNLRWLFILESKKNKLPSISLTYPASTWSEREMQDMFSVTFQGLKDTRRLLLDYKITRGVLSPEIKIKGIINYSSFFDLYYI